MTVYEKKKIEQVEYLAHELKQIQSVNRCCQSLIRQLKGIQERQDGRIQEFSKRLDAFALYKNGLEQPGEVTSILEEG